jgi:hypothetical protein
MKKEQTTINTMDKELTFEEVVIILESFQNTEVTLNYGKIYGIDTYEDFSVWLDGEKNNILMLYNGNGSEQCKMIYKKDFIYGYIDEFLESSNVCLELEGNDWIQVYVED